MAVTSTDVDVIARFCPYGRAEMAVLWLIRLFWPQQNFLDGYLWF